MKPLDDELMPSPAELEEWCEDNFSDEKKEEVPLGLEEKILIDSMEIPLSRIRDRKINGAKEVRLFKEAKKDREKRQQFIENNFGLVVRVVKRVAQVGTERFKDLFQEGVIGLIWAFDRFDPDRGFRFSTYATWWIRQSVLRALVDLERLMHVPFQVVERVEKRQKVETELTQVLGRPPSEEEIAKELGVSVEELRYNFPLKETVLSLNHRRTDQEQEDRDLEESIPDFLNANPEHLVEQAGLCKLLDQAISRLYPPRKQAIVRMRYGLDDGCGHTLEEVGDFLGLSRERVRQIEKEAFEFLRIELLELRAYYINLPDQETRTVKDVESRQGKPLKIKNLPKLTDRAALELNNLAVGVDGHYYIAALSTQLSQKLGVSSSMMGPIVEELVRQRKVCRIPDDQLSDFGIRKNRKTKYYQVL